MSKYKIVQQATPANGQDWQTTIYKKKWWGWKHLREWYASPEEAEKIITKRHFMKAEYRVVKEVEFL